MEKLSSLSMREEKVRSSFDKQEAREAKNLLLFCKKEVYALCFAYQMI
jgi:hypothetical protein